MKVLPKVVGINNLLTIQLEKNNHELDYIEKNILVHPNIHAPPPLDIKWWPPKTYWLQKVPILKGGHLRQVPHHMVILRSQNKITDFFMTLAWVWAFNYY